MVTRKRLGAEPFQQNLQTIPIGREETLLQTFVIVRVEQFSVPIFAAASANLGGKIQVIYDVIASHKQEIYPVTSLDENCTAHVCRMRSSLAMWIGWVCFCIWSFGGSFFTLNFLLFLNAFSTLLLTCLGFFAMSVKDLLLIGALWLCLFVYCHCFS